MQRTHGGRAGSHPSAALRAEPRPARRREGGLRPRAHANRAAGRREGGSAADNSVENDATSWSPDGTFSHMRTATMEHARGLSPEAMWTAFRRGDPHYDGRFVTAVRTTGIFCRP